MKQLLQLSDDALIQLFITGNEYSFQILYKRHQQSVFNTVLYYVKDRTLAEDLSQEAFIKIFTSIKAARYCESGKFLPWALRIVHNHCMDYLRKPKRISYVSDFSSSFFAQLSSPSPEAKLLKEQASAQLNLLISKLPDEQKKVVYYRHFEEMSFKEIAHLTNTSVNTTLGRMRYALMHLRSMARHVPAKPVRKVTAQ